MVSSSCRLCRCVLVVLAMAIVPGIFVYELFQSSNFTNDTTPAPSPKPSNYTGPRAVSTLKFIAVVSRHGNRPPLYGYPNDPYQINNTHYWPYGVGMLTPQGRVEMYNLGAKIRSLYNGFLKTDYYSSDLYATSTLVDRAMTSGEAFLAGLYPPSGFQLWDKDILWQPIPLYTDSLDKTVVIGQNCPRFTQENAKSSAAFLAEYGANISAVMDLIHTYAGTNASAAGFMNFVTIWDSFVSERFEGFTLPEWTKAVYPEPMNDISGALFTAHFAGTDEATRLLIGEFLEQMLGVMKSKVNGTLSPDRSIYFYSGHDASLVALQVVLGIPRPSVLGRVDPGSGMVFEIHQDKNTARYYVQVVYMSGGDPTLEPSLIDIPNCGVSCDFDQFINISLKFTEVDYEEECQLNSTSHSHRLRATSHDLSTLF